MALVEEEKISLSFASEPDLDEGGVTVTKGEQKRWVGAFKGRRQIRVRDGPVGSDTV